MLKSKWKMFAFGLALLTAWQALPFGSNVANAKHGWDGKRRISYQHQKDLFYNYYVGGTGGSAAAQLYESPLPTPPFVGHTYVTYQPFMPHEYMYRHMRSYYTYNPGAGWTRTNVRYRTGGNLLQDLLFFKHGDKGSRFTDSLNDSMSYRNLFGR